MEPCLLSHIPPRLHRATQPLLPTFLLGESLYRRAPEDSAIEPFDGVSLVDLSVNRAGPDVQAPLCQPDDVLWNFNLTSRQPSPRLIGQVVVPLEIQELTEAGVYEKTMTMPRIGQTQLHTCTIRLHHKPEACNYAHCAFEIWYDGVEMTFDNYNESLRKHIPLRTWCKKELVKMLVLWCVVRINWPV